MPEMPEIAYLCSNKLFDFQKMPEKTPSNSDRKGVAVEETPAGSLSYSCLFPITEFAAGWGVLPPKPPHTVVYICLRYFDVDKLLELSFALNIFNR